jgi:hypothetical protein
MTDKETMKMALEFIERVNKEGWILDDFEPQMYEAIAALKERLAQPEQEPVAWMDASRFEELRYGFTVMTTLTKKKAFFDDIAIYATPPQRTWVGLTDEEIKAMDAGVTSNSSFYAGALWAEAKLKEKNNG